MSEPFIAEIRMFGFNYAPRGWAQCNGQIMQIAQNSALFSLIGTTYGGNGTTTFGLPNLQGRAALHWGQGPGLSSRSIGQTGGTANVTLSQAQIPQHTHAVNASANNADQASPTNNAWATGVVGRGNVNLYSSTTDSTMNPAALSPAGGNQPHDNMPPYLVMNFCMAIQGIYPSRN